MSEKAKMSREEFRRLTLETFLLYLFTHQMSLEALKTVLGKVETQALLDFPDLRGSGIRWSLCGELTERLRWVEASVVTARPAATGECEQCAAPDVPLYECPADPSSRGARDWLVCLKCRPKFVEASIDSRGTIPNEDGSVRSAEETTRVHAVRLNEAWHLLYRAKGHLPADVRAEVSAFLAVPQPLVEGAPPARAIEFVLGDVARIAFTESWDANVAMGRIRALLDPPASDAPKVEVAT